MVIDRPVVFIIMEGNVKQKVSTVPHTAVATYEAKDKHTAVFVMVAGEGYSEKDILRSVKEVYKNYGKILKMEYHKNGATIIQAITNN